MPYGNFYYGKTGFFYKKSGATGARYNPSLAAICNQPQDVNNRFVPGSGVGASSTAQRRAKLIHSYNANAPQKDGQGPQRLGVFAQGGSNAYALNWGLYNGPYVSPATTVSPVPTPTPIILSAPTNLSQTSNTLTTITFTFTPPDSQGTTITNYEYSTDSGSTFVAFSPSQTTSSVTITGLSAGTSYNIALRAVNQYGVGANSIAVSMSTAFSAPGRPTALRLFSSDSTTNAVIDVTPGASNGFTITNYQYSLDGTNFTDVDVYQQFLTTIYNIPSFTTLGNVYTIYLRSVTSTGVYSSPSAPMTMIYGDSLCDVNTSGQYVLVVRGPYGSRTAKEVFQAAPVTLSPAWYVGNGYNTQIIAIEYPGGDFVGKVQITTSPASYVIGARYNFYIPSTP
jgi:hypothetical protein